MSKQKQKKTSNAVGISATNTEKKKVNEKSKLAQLLFSGGPKKSEIIEQLEIKKWIERGNLAIANKEYNKAYIWYKKAADAGDGGAAYSLCLILNEYASHVSVEKSSDALFYYLDKAAQQELPEALFDMGCAFLQGSMGSQDINKAAMFFVKASEKGHKPSLLSLAKILLDLPDQEGKKRGFETLKKLVELHNYPAAFTPLGICYLKGIGTSQNPKKGLEYLEVAKNKNDRDAISEMALVYLKGVIGSTEAEVIEINIKKGLELLELAANLDSEKDLMLLSQVYEHGMFEQPIDLKRSFEYLHKADALGDPKAKYRLGFAYLFGGDFLAIDEELGLQKIKELASDNHPAALNALGNCYATGRGFPQHKKDLAMAFECYKKSSEHGYIVGTRSLALAYRNGKGVAQDLKKAFELMVKVAEKGLLDDKNMLASFYMSGIGVEKNNAKAAEMLLEILRDENTNTCPHAMVNMAKLYFTGWDKGTKDRKKALELLETASKLNCISATLELSERYRFGIDVERNPRLAYELATQALQQQDPLQNGQFFDDLHLIHLTLGDYYFNGVGTKRDHHKAMLHYEQSAAAGNTKACNGLAACLLITCTKKGDQEKAFSLLLQAESEGNVEASNNLGWCYLYGLGTEKNIEKALELFAHASQNGIRRATNNIAWCYLNGLGLKQDIYRAKELFQQNKQHKGTGIFHNGVSLFTFAMTPGSLGVENMQDVLCKYYHAYCQLYGFGIKQNPEAAFAVLRAISKYLVEARVLIAECFFEGLSVQKDATKALEILNSAAKEHPRLKSKLAYAYLFGPKPDHKLAVKILLEASNEGHAKGTCLLATCYEKGLGVTIDQQLAIELYEKAAKLGAVDAQLYLGQRYQKGHAGLSVDFKKSFEFFAMAANNGNVTARYEMAMCLEDGIGVTKDLKRAVEIYQALADLNHGPAQNNLGLLYANGFEGFPCKPQYARHLFALASNNGVLFGKVQLAILCEDGIGGPVDLIKAKSLQDEIIAIAKDQKDSEEVLTLIQQGYITSTTGGAGVATVLFHAAGASSQQKTESASTDFQSLPVSNDQHSPATPREETKASVLQKRR